MTGAVATFVKTPSLSPVRPRLASDVGQLRAEAFYLSSDEADADALGISPPEAAELRAGRSEIDYLPYDWSLNRSRP